MFISTFSICLSQREHPTTFGFKLGLNQSYINGVEPNGTKTGFTALDLYGSFFMDTKIGENTSFENELLYSYTDEIHFIEIPLHLKHTILKDFRVLYGAKLDFIVNTNYNLSHYKPVTFSAEIGTQYFISKKLFLELRYSKGLMNQIDMDFLEVYDGKRDNLRLGVGIKF